MPIVIPASEAKARFSELLDRVQSGESFTITVHGEATANLVSVARLSREEIQRAIAQMKACRTVLNPRRKSKLKIRDLIKEGRP
jgi:prevent-host-death family protein